MSLPATRWMQSPDQADAWLLILEPSTRVVANLVHQPPFWWRRESDVAYLDVDAAKRGIQDNYHAAYYWTIR